MPTNKEIENTDNIINTTCSTTRSIVPYGENKFISISSLIEQIKHNNPVIIKCDKCDDYQELLNKINCVLANKENQMCNITQENIDQIIYCQVTNKQTNMIIQSSNNLFSKLFNLLDYVAKKIKTELQPYTMYIHYNNLNCKLECNMNSAIINCFNKLTSKSLKISVTKSGTIDVCFEILLTQIKLLKINNITELIIKWNKKCIIVIYSKLTNDLNIHVTQELFSDTVCKFLKEIDIFTNFITITFIRTDIFQKISQITFNMSVEMNTHTTLETFTETNTKQEKSTLTMYSIKLKILEKNNIKLDGSLTGDQIVDALQNYYNKEKNKNYSNNSLHLFMASIHDYLKKNDGNETLIKDIYEKMIMYRRICDERNKLNLTSDNEEIIDWKVVLQTQKQLELKKDKNFKSYTDYVLVSLYCMIPPRRNDYAGMLIVKNKKEVKSGNNYYIIDDKTLIFNKYKTAKVKTRDNNQNYIVKTQDIVVCDELANIIAGYINHPGNKHNNIMFSNVMFVSRRLKQIFGISKPIDTLRHSVVNYYNNNINVGERIKLAENMSHSVMMQLYYVKK